MTRTTTSNRPSHAVYVVEGEGESAYQHTDPARRMQDPTSSLALEAYAADLDYWRERIPAAPADAWDWCLRQDTETLLAVLAVYSALSIMR